MIPYFLNIENAMRILILSDGIPGHVNQSIGICHMLQGETNCTFEVHELAWKLHFLRSPLKIFIRFLCSFLNTFTAHLIQGLFKPIMVQDFDLIVAAGGNTMALNAAVGLIHKIPNIQLGSPRGIPSRLFSVHLTSEKFDDHPSNIVFDITPNKYSPSNCSRASINFHPQDFILLLIGGDGIGYTYSFSEYERFIDNINEFSKHSNNEILCVTSRRTDPKVENLFFQNIKQISEHSIWFHQGGANADLAKLFGSAQHIMVTEDSAMMISEAISSGNLVTTIYPKVINSPSRYDNQIQHYLNRGFMSRSSMEATISLDFNRKNSSALIEGVQKQLVKSIIEKIQL